MNLNIRSIGVFLNRVRKTSYSACETQASQHATIGRLKRVENASLFKIESYLQNELIQKYQAYFLRLKTKKHLESYNLRKSLVFDAASKEEIQKLVHTKEDYQLLKTIIKNNRQVDGSYDVFEVVKNLRDAYSPIKFSSNKFNGFEIEEIKFKKDKIKTKLEHFRDYYGQKLYPDEINHVIGLIKTPDHGKLAVEIAKIKDHGQVTVGTLTKYGLMRYIGKFENCTKTKKLSEILSAKNRNGVNLFDAQFKEEILEFVNSDKDIELLLKIKKLMKYDEEHAIKLMKNLFKLKSKNLKAYDDFVESDIIKLFKKHKNIGAYSDCIGENKQFSRMVLKDTKKDVSRQSIIIQYPPSIDKYQVIAETKEGDVIEVSKELFVNDGGVLTKLNLSPQKFLELFPARVRFTSIQGNLNNCWQAANIDNLMNSGVGQSAVYKLFRQEGNDIYIKFPNVKAEVKFKDSNINVSPTGKNMKGYCKGVQMIEQAFAFIRHSDPEEKILFDAVSVGNIDKQMKKLGGSKNYLEFTKKVFPQKVNEILSLNKIEIKSLIEELANNPKIMLQITFRQDVASKDLYKYHLYSIKGYNPETGKVSISNPWHPAYTTELSIYDVIKHAKGVGCIKV